QSRTSCAVNRLGELHSADARCTFCVARKSGEEGPRLMPSTEKRSMRTLILWIATLAMAIPALPLVVRAQTKDETPASKPEAAKVEQFKPEQQASKGSVTVGG